MGISKWNAGIIRPVPVAPTGPYQNSSAPGVWTVDQQAYWQKQGLWPTAGNVINYIEDVFSTYLYTGNGSTQTITNGIDLSTKGGLVWLKNRDNYYNNVLVDTTRGVNQAILSNSTAAQTTYGTTVNGFNSNGFALGSNDNANGGSLTYVSWTFREQPKFFDVVTYTGTGSNTTIAHSLGAIPGCIIVKRTDTTAAWAVYHRSLANTQYLVLNTTAAAATGATWWNSTTPTSAVFSVGTDASVNASGGTYVAYIYAHDAGGFGLTGTDNVISCGSFTSNVSQVVAEQTLGWEPQFLYIKSATGAGVHFLMDNMRNSMPASAQYNYLRAEVSDPEVSGAAKVIQATATGFNGANFNASETFIYIAIRRGPMAVPTLGTSVFFPKVIGGQGAIQTITGFGFPVDLITTKNLYNTETWAWTDRLRGPTLELTSAAGTAEITYANDITSFALMDGFTVGTGAGGNVNTNGTIYVHYGFRRAPSFFDEVCYTGTGVANRNIAHNLGAVPELFIVKARTANAAGLGMVYSQTGGADKFLRLFEATTSNLPFTTNTNPWANTTPTATQFTVDGSGGYLYTNSASDTYVCWLFATCAGVSKVGSYTGTGALQTVACGFTSGARFVLIKRTDTTGDWYAWDSSNGITAGNDPYVLFNSTAIQATGTNYVDTDTTGFKVTAAAPAGINANGGTYIFLAIA